MFEHNLIGHFLFWNDVSFVPVRVLHKDETILGRKHIYLPHAQTGIYDSKGKVIFKTGNIPFTWSWLNAVVRFECENSAIDVIIIFLWKIFHKPIVPVVLTTANFFWEGSLISTGTIHDLRRVTVPGTGPLWNPWILHGFLLQIIYTTVFF